MGPNSQDSIETGDEETDARDSSGNGTQDSAGQAADNYSSGVNDLQIPEARV